MHRLSLLLVALALAACGDDAAEPAPEPPPAPTSPTSSRQTALDVAETSPRLSTFASLVDVAGLRETLADTAQVFTVFAPANAAFADVDLDALRADPEALRARLLAHVLANRTFSGDVFGEITIETVAGSDLTLNATDAGVALRDTRGTAATITEADLDGDNGVVHIIDTLLSGPTGS
ncbi:MAG: fasciclin domain-containing protein [Bacteroidota bacterium]